MDNINYKNAGVDIDAADGVKRRIGGVVSSAGLPHCTPVNRVGAFASLLEIDLSDYENPVFVLKSEEPGSKQLLSIDNGRVEWIARDLINHLVNDVIVMGVTPCAVLDTIICGKLEPDIVFRLISAMSEACGENGCILVGGETSEQPGVIPEGRYILQASILGIADKGKIIDGSAIRRGDAVLALASNGPHTNGYSLIRKLMEAKPEILCEDVNGESFMDCILKPHASYAAPVKKLLGERRDDIHGMAHITGGGIHDNLIRIMQNDRLQARIDLSAVRVPEIFKIIKKYANSGDGDMLRTFNNGAGMVLVADGASAGGIIRALDDYGAEAYVIGGIEEGPRAVDFYNTLIWD